jgi:hypothetical protein
MLDLERRTFSTLTESEWGTAFQELSLFYKGTLVFAKTTLSLRELQFSPNSILPLPLYL